MVPLPWFQSLSLLGSHLPIVPLLVVAYTSYPVSHQSGLIFVILAATGFFSFLYHLCGATNQCAFGGDLLTWTRLDYTFAYSNIVIAFVIAITNGIEKKMSDLFWTTVINLAMVFSVVAIVDIRLQSLSQPLDIRTASLVVVIGLVAVWLKIVCIGSSQRIFSKFANRFVLIGSLIIVVALVFFFLDSSTYYWFFHSMWHATVFLGFAFLLYGVHKELVPGTLTQQHLPTRLPPPSPLSSPASPLATPTTLLPLPNISAAAAATATAATMATFGKFDTDDDDGDDDAYDFSVQLP
jgi:hypothetical protein